MKYVFVIEFLFIIGCGFSGTEKVETNDSNQNINVNFTFINQLIKLCQQKLLVSDYPSADLYDQAVANCVFGSLSVTSGSNPLCQPNADLSGFTPDQVAQILATCRALK